MTAEALPAPRHSTTRAKAPRTARRRQTRCERRPSGVTAPRSAVLKPLPRHDPVIPPPPPSRSWCRRLTRCSAPLYRRTAHRTKDERRISRWTKPHHTAPRGLPLHAPARGLGSTTRSDRLAGCPRDFCFAMAKQKSDRGWPALLLLVRSASDVPSSAHARNAAQAVRLLGGAPGR